MEAYGEARTAIKDKWDALADWGTDYYTCLEHGCPTSGFDDGSGLSVYMRVNKFRQDLRDLQPKLMVDAFGDHLGAIMNATDTFYCNMRCGFVAQFYEATYQDFCVTTMGGFGQVALALFLLALFNIPIMLTSCMLSRRLRKPTKLEHTVVPVGGGMPVVVPQHGNPTGQGNLQVIF
uniref:Uncharacterized protein n=1 Tax=Fibrocapsa japonica TaxID=94617 RepID=A0A7S2UZD3_9STRA